MDDNCQSTLPESTKDTRETKTHDQLEHSSIILGDSQYTHSTINASSSREEQNSVSLDPLYYSHSVLLFEKTTSKPSDKSANLDQSSVYLGESKYTNTTVSGSLCTTDQNSLSLDAHYYSHSAFLENAILKPSDGSISLDSKDYTHSMNQHNADITEHSVQLDNDCYTQSIRDQSYDVTSMQSLSLDDDECTRSLNEHQIFHVHLLKDGPPTAPIQDPDNWTEDLLIPDTIDQWNAERALVNQKELLDSTWIEDPEQL